MRLYRVTLDVYNTRQPFPSQRVTLLRRAFSPKDAVRGIGAVYVSADGSVVNTTGAVGRNGAYYNEWDFVGARISRRAEPAL